MKQHVVFSREGISASVFDVEEVFDNVKKKYNNQYIFRNTSW